jgi:hypothetical protein
MLKDEKARLLAASYKALSRTVARRRGSDVVDEEAQCGQLALLLPS